MCGIVLYAVLWNFMRSVAYLNEIVCIEGIVLTDSFLFDLLEQNANANV